MDDNTIDKLTSQSVYDHDGSEKTPLYAKNNNEKALLKWIIAFCMVFCIGLLFILLIHIHYGSNQLVPHGNVASDNDQCSQYGIDVLKMGGNAVDAAITAALCNSVVLLHLSGLGGNGVMVVYDHRTGIGNTIDFRATPSSHNITGVPGFLAGLFYANVKYGILPWKTLVEPSINLAKTGITVTESLLEAINQNTTKLIEDENLKHWISTVSNSSLGQIIKVPNGLIKTLTSISLHGPLEFYKEMSEELKLILKPDDVMSYQPLILPVLRQTYMKYCIITSNKGTGGPILLKVLNKINNTNTYLEDLSLLNSFKDLGDNWDQNFGLQVSTTDVFDLYVTIISGLGSVFGSRVLTKSGYILNNALDLNLNSHMLNQTERVTSLHLPIIAVETGNLCGRRLISGAADVRDGTQLLLSMLKTDPQDILNVNTITRFHFKNNDVDIEYPYNITKQFLKLLDNFGYNLFNVTYPTSNIIQKVEDRSVAFSDSRGSGKSYTL
ncbi:glutathione hydrolase 7-like isoform X1 [Aphis gossypii]|uniref:glutathione hydrolase 7-like isoform X1 n=1 Tax=Aphis gossypii TaxID=80765 RepID=UPI002159AFFE|nr:glutathione hydrolase 7-like isoform X1 [Aphis gossypii]XP_027850178.2 glutathione hydrolase 7-like isoform X1 [Aphis gossypii]XP_050057430.1 glutathione hydrolase 7-like isoform X1 [Aphis gossypii]